MDNEQKPNEITTHSPESTSGAAPVVSKKRHVILDALRGFALLGVCLANYPEFSLFTFLTPQQQAAMPSSVIDTVTHWLMLIFIDGKFYTLFSLLFGIGFSIIIAHARERGANGMMIFYRRMVLLALIGLAHLLLAWSGDILLLYAILGMLLPLASNWSNHRLLSVAAILLAVPVFVDSVAELLDIELGETLQPLQWYYCSQVGITADNFATWLRDSQSYTGVSNFLMQGAFERMWEFVVGNRYFKVMGLFLLGFYIGRNKIYAQLDFNIELILRVSRLGLWVGLPASVLYAWSAMNSHPLGNAFHTLLYTLSVYPLGLAYAAIIARLYMRNHRHNVWKILAAPGRMALSCYICQSLIGMLLFYGVGFGLGTRLGLLQTEIVALAVFTFETVLCILWLRQMRFGPLEWIWRILTYGKLLPLRKENN